MDVVRRVSVIGNSGSGKTRLARQLAEHVGVPFVELDALHHLAGWEPIDPDVFLLRVREIADTDSWVIDGNYRTVVMDGPVWQRADTIVWVDLPRWQTIWQVTSRSVARAVTRQELWNGNRESVRNLFARDPDRSIIRWSWTQHGKYRDRYGTAMTDPRLGHITFVRLSSRRRAAQWFASLP